MSRPPDIDALTPAELKSLALQLLEAAAEDQRTIAALRDELARLKGGPGRPDIKPNVKPSGMEKATEPKLEEPPGKDRRRGEVRAKLTINEERKLEADAPLGSRFKGYASFLVQDLVIRPHVTDFLRACWRTPEGKSVIAPLPPGVEGHFGPELRRLVLALYHQGQVTAGRLVELLRGFGVLISKRQVVRLLIAGKQGFLDEARDVLRAGLTDAAWITVDDTGARHKGKNGYCTQIGNAHFTWFGRVLEEPPQLSRTVARRTWRLRRQRRSSRLYARPRARRTRHRSTERASRSLVRRSGGLERTPRPSRRLGLEGPSRSRSDRP